MGSKRRIPGYHPAISRDHRAADGHGVSLKKQGFYHKTAWRRLRKQALQRDNYLCRECLRRGKITQATEVHHIMDLETFPSLALELSNLESLCWDCHEQTKHHKRELHIPGVRIIPITDKNDTEDGNEDPF